jgi:cell pole-organizing protein PopZ
MEKIFETTERRTLERLVEHEIRMTENVIDFWKDQNSPDIVETYVEQIKTLEDALLKIKNNSR